MYFTCASLNAIVSQSYNKLERREDGKRETERVEINWWIKCEESSATAVEKNMYWTLKLME